MANLVSRRYMSLLCIDYPTEPDTCSSAHVSAVLGIVNVDKRQRIVVLERKVQFQHLHTHVRRRDRDTVRAGVLAQRVDQLQCVTTRPTRHSYAHRRHVDPLRLRALIAEERLEHRLVHVASFDAFEQRTRRHKRATASVLWQPRHPPYDAACAGVAAYDAQRKHMNITQALRT
jgi:hypothetical protein